MKQNAILIIFMCVLLIVLTIGIVVDARIFDNNGVALTTPCKSREISHQSNGGFVMNIPVSYPTKMESKLSIVLEKQYSNKYFTLKYPSSWQIVQDDNQVTNSTAISVQIMEIQKNNYDFRPNINIIVSGQKRMESTSELARITIMQQKQYFKGYNFIRQTNNIVLSKANGCVIEYQFNVQGYLLHGVQYIVKKPDNTTFVITGTMDAYKYEKQQSIMEEIIKSLIIK